MKELNVVVDNLTDKPISSVEASNLERLRVNELLTGLDDKTFNKFAKRCQFISFDQGDHLVDEGDDQDCVFLMVAGIVRVVYGEDPDSSLVFSEVREGGWFGEIAALDKGDRTATIFAVTDGVVVVLPRAVFVNLILEHRQIAVKVMESLASMIRSSNNRFKQNTTLTSSQRVYQQLLNLVEKDLSQDGTWVIHHVPSHETLASNAMTSKDIVADALSELFQDGVAKRSFGKLVIHDRDRLTQLATGIGNGSCFGNPLNAGVRPKADFERNAKPGAH